MCVGRTVIPMKLLKELALGNIQPMVRNFKKDSVFDALTAKNGRKPPENSRNHHTLPQILRTRKTPGSQCLKGFRGIFIHRGTRIRTQDTRFWRPLLYQLSYAPLHWHILPQFFCVFKLFLKIYSDIGLSGQKCVNCEEEALFQVS